MPMVEVQIETYSRAVVHIREGSQAHRLLLAYEETNSDKDFEALEEYIREDVADEIEFWIESVRRLP